MRHHLYFLIPTVLAFDIPPDRLRGRNIQPPATETSTAVPSGIYSATGPGSSSADLGAILSSIAAHDTARYWNTSSTTTSAPPLLGSGTGLRTIPLSTGRSARTTVRASSLDDLPPSIVIDSQTYDYPAGTSLKTIIPVSGTTVVLGPSGVEVGSQQISVPAYVTQATTLTGSAGTMVLTPAQTPNVAALPKVVEVDWQGAAYLLPPEAITLPGDDDKPENAITLGPDYVAIGTETVKVPAMSAQTTITSPSGKFSLTARPGPQDKPDKGGLSGLAALLHIFGDLTSGLVKTASDIGKTLDDIGVKGAALAAKEIGDVTGDDVKTFAKQIDPLLSGMGGQLRDLIGGCSGIQEEMGIELQQLSRSGQSLFIKTRDSTIGLQDTTSWLSRIGQSLSTRETIPMGIQRFYWRFALSTVKSGAVGLSIAWGAREIMKSFSNKTWSQEMGTDSTISGQVPVAASSTLSQNLPPGVQPTIPTPYPSSNATNSTSNDIRELYMFATKHHTSKETYYTLIKNLPDQGQGIVSQYDNLDFQSYGTNLTKLEAEQLKTNPIVAFLHRVPDPGVDDDTDFAAMSGLTSPNARENAKRAEIPINMDFSIRTPSDMHLKLISQARGGNPGVAPNAEYFFNPPLGEGATVYIIDSGINRDHSEFADLIRDGRLETHTISNAETLSPGDVALDMRDWNYYDESSKTYTGHGTGVAAVAVGRTKGVASRATLAFIKGKGQQIKPGTINNPDHKGDPIVQARGWTSLAVTRAFQTAMSDIASKGRQGRAVINFSIGFTRNIPNVPAKQELANAMDDIIRHHLTNMDDMGVPLVLAAGNNGKDSIRGSAESLSDITPQRWGTTDNNIITVGGVNADGTFWTDTTPQLGTNPDDGSMTVYAFANGVNSAVAGTKWRSSLNNQYAPQRGTSFSAPAVTGLMAYFMSIRIAQGTDFITGKTTFGTGYDAKEFLVKNAYPRISPQQAQTLPWNELQFGANNRPGPPLVAYNAAHDGFCAANPAQKRSEGDKLRFPRSALQPRATTTTSGGIVSDVPVMVSGKLVASQLAFSNAACAKTMNSESPVSSTVAPSSTASIPASLETTTIPSIQSNQPSLTVTSNQVEVDPSPSVAAPLAPSPRTSTTVVTVTPTASPSPSPTAETLCAFATPAPSNQDELLVLRGDHWPKSDIDKMDKGKVLCDYLDWCTYNIRQCKFTFDGADETGFEASAIVPKDTANPCVGDALEKAGLKRVDCVHQ